MKKAERSELLQRNQRLASLCDEFMEETKTKPTEAWPPDKTAGFLEPCPFCGSTRASFAKRQINEKIRYCIVCSTCAGSSTAHETGGIYAAVNAWQRRV